MEHKSKDNEILNASHRFYIDSNTANALFVEVFNEFTGTIGAFYNNDLQNTELIQTYKNIGKMELINALIDDRDYKHLLSTGKKVLSQYIKIDG